MAIAIAIIIVIGGTAIITDDATITGAIAVTITDTTTIVMAVTTIIIEPRFLSPAQRRNAGAARM